MKINSLITSRILVAGLILAASATLQATPNFVVAAFATGTQGENSQTDGTYGQYNGDCLEVGYGAGTITWDGTHFDAADGSTGSAYITATFGAANNTEDYIMMGPGYNNWYFEGDSGSCPTGTVDGTQYHALQFDILYDTNSALTLQEFNTGDGWPTNYFVDPAVGPNYMATNSYYTAGLNVLFFTGSGGGTVGIGSFQVPAGAATSWQTVTIPYSDGIAGLGPVAGVIFDGYFGGGGELVGNYNASFWIDNLQLIGNATLSPPPTMYPPTTATPGLNIFNASVGTGAYPYSDRNEVLAKITNGLSWVGHPGASYSFNMASFPNGSNFTGEAFMFLVPNAVSADQAADYNESNCVVLEVQSTATGTQAIIQVKTNLPSSETYSTIATVQSTQAAGNYTLTFTGDDAGTLTTPDGSSTNFTFLSGTGAAYFAEGGSKPNFLIYLGTQANDATFVNKPVVYQSVTVSGPPNGSSISENFVTDANNGTAMQNWGSTWPGNGTTYPAGNVLVPTNGVYWVSWSLPSSGYGLVDTSKLGTSASWNSVGTFAPIALYNVDQQLVASQDLTGPQAEYFAMVHRTFSQLVVVLPGQTFTPGKAPGYSGTPAPVSLDGQPYAQEIVTVYAVDSGYNPVPGITDEIALTSSDPNSILPNNTAMVNGSVTFGNSNPFLFADSGSWTVTASDASNPAITSGTSASVTVNP